MTLRILVVMVWCLLVAGEVGATVRFVDSTCSAVSTYNPATQACTGGSQLVYPTTSAGLTATTAAGDALWIVGNGRVYTTGGIRSASGYTSGGTPGNNITIGGCPASLCGTNHYPIIRLSGGANGLSLTNGNNSYTTLTRLKFDEINNPGQDQGAMIFYIHHILLEDIELYNVSRHGLICGCDDSEIRYSYFHDIGTDNVHPRGNAIYMNGSRVRVHHSRFENLFEAAVWFNTYPAEGAYGPWLSNDNRFDHNFVKNANNGGNTAGQRTTFDHNIVRDLAGYGFGFNYCTTHLPSIPTQCGIDGVFVFNTLYNVADNPIQIGQYGAITGVRISDNIMHCANSGTYPVWIFDAGDTGETITYNRFWNCGSINNLGSATISNNTTTNPSFTNVASDNFALTSSSDAIGAGTSVSGFACNVTCDLGAFETATYASATINGVSVDLTLGMSLHTPALPASGATGITVACSGTNCGTPVVGTATRLTGADSVFRLSLTGLGGAGVCEAGQTWTVSYSGSGNITDSALIGNSKNQPLRAFSTQAVTNGCGGSVTPPPGSPYLSYTFENNTGTTVTDQSGNARHGTLTNGPGWTTGHAGFGVQMLGNDDYVAVPYGSAVNPSTQSVTISTAILPAAGTEADTHTVLGATFSAGNLFYLSRIAGTWRLGIQATGAVDPSEFAVTSNWTHLCVTLDSGTDTATLSVNGVASTTTGGLRTYSSHTWAGNLRAGLPESFGASAAPLNDSYDDLKVWTGVVSCATEYAAWSPSSPPASGTYAQVGHQFKKARRKVDLTAENYGAANATPEIRQGGYFALDIQTDCTSAADCAAIGRRWMYSRNGGAFGAVPDQFSADQFMFIQTMDPSLIVDPTLGYLLTGALTRFDGTTQVTSAAVPVTDFTQGSSQVLRGIFLLGPTASGTYCLKLYDQSGTVYNGTYTPANGACFTVGLTAAGY